MESSNAVPAALYSPEPLPPTQKRGPEPIEEVLTKNTGTMEFKLEDGRSGAATLPLVVKTSVSTPALDETETVVEEAALDSDILSKIAVSPEIAEALAAEGLEINQDEIARALDENKRRGELEAALSPGSSVVDLQKVFTADEVRQAEDLTPVTPEAFRDLKFEINASFEEVASLLLEHQRQIDEIEARLTSHNARGGHKI